STIAGRRRSRQEARPPPFAAPDRPQREALGAALERHAEADEMRERPEQPHRELDQSGGERDRTAAQKLEHGAGFGALRGSELCQPSEVLRLFREPQALDRRAAAGLALHPAEVAGRADEILRPLESGEAQESRADPAGLRPGLDDR